MSYVKGGVFVEVKPDNKHPLACGLCPKGVAGPELVYNKQRLRYPIRRTNPKGDSNPGWKRITWDEALDTIAIKLNEIKATFGPEAVAFARSGPAGSPMGELDPWVSRLAHVFGSPNHIATTHICQWHRDSCSSYTYGNIGGRGAAGRAEFEQAGCILIWGNNTNVTRHSLFPLIKRGLKQGAKLIVIDPRKTEIAAMADLWLQVYPGTDGALALSIINVMLEENLYDYEFVKDWTTAPLLIRSDTGNFLKASDLTEDGDPLAYVIVNHLTKTPKICFPGTPPPFEPNLDFTYVAKLANGREVECKTVFNLLREFTSEYHPKRVSVFTKVPEGKIRDTARMFSTNKPACWYSWNGIEQSTNASQTNRAVCILYALTGDYDTPGGNVILHRLSVNPIDGREFLSKEVEKRRLGFRERPIGPAGIAWSTQAYEVYKSILTGNPYSIKGLLGFGGNLITASPPSKVAKDAISKLDFHAQAELFLTPTAELADIVLPAASFWESWHAGINVESLGTKAYIQLRPAVVPPRYESRPDMKIIFELAKRLGLGDKFWDGNIEAAFNYQFAPLNVTIKQLMVNGFISIDLPMEYRKYRKKDHTGKFLGFSTPSKRVEIYSQTFKENGYNPLPAWEEQLFRGLTQAELSEKYPLILIGAKVVEYCHSQHRALPPLRKVVPNPFLEINPIKAQEIGCKEGDWVILESPSGSITVQAKLMDGIPYNVVCTQNGWWQSCLELDLPGFDPYSQEGANVNLLYGTDKIDPISGSLPIKGYPCNVRRK
jgi:anaerobic selenocysteine-containing dehydrogenase